jgi:hypothetical protein
VIENTEHPRLADVLRRERPKGEPVAAGRELGAPEDRACWDSRGRDTGGGKALSSRIVPAA